MNELYELREKLCDELKSYGKRDVSSGSLDVVDKLAHTVKNLDKIIEKYDGEEYSMNDGYSRRRRDSRERYSSRNSYHGDMMGELRSLMDDAPDENTRREFKRFIDKMESM